MTNLEEKARELAKENICKKASTKSAFLDSIACGLVLIPGIDSFLEGKNYGIIPLSLVVGYFFGRKAYKKYKLVRDLDQIVNRDGTINNNYKL